MNPNLKKPSLMKNFLDLFTLEIILSLINDKKARDNVELEKLKIKLFKNTPEEIAFKQIITHKKEKDKKVRRNKVPEKHKVQVPEQQFVKSQEIQRKHTFYRENIHENPMIKIKSKPVPPKQSIQKLREPIELPHRSIQVIQHPVPTQTQNIPEQYRVQNINVQQSKTSGMDKINPLLRDSSVHLIECIGPGKNVMVKRYDKINMTRIILSQGEISEIINNYSMQARIPLVGGILKAAVGNTIISAVASEFAGSRFIINKITPYSIVHKESMKF